MLNLQIENLFKISKNHSLSQKDIDEGLKNLPIHLENFLKKDQGWYKILDDSETIRIPAASCRGIFTKGFYFYAASCEVFGSFLPSFRSEM